MRVAWEFRHRTWLILGIFCIGLACYGFDPHNSGAVAASWLHANIAPLRAYSPRAIVRCIFALAALVVAVGATIRAWGGAYLRTEVFQDSELRTERLIADGPFRYTRNPLYLGILVGVIGAGAMSSPVGCIVQTGLSLVFIYQLIRREEVELLKAHGEVFRAYCRAVPRFLPAIAPRVPASGAHPHWGEALAAQLAWWGIAAANVVWAITLRPSLAFAVAAGGFVLFMGQKYVLKARARPVAAP